MGLSGSSILIMSRKERKGGEGGELEGEKGEGPLCFLPRRGPALISEKEKERGEGEKALDFEEEEGTLRGLH